MIELVMCEIQHQIHFQQDRVLANFVLSARNILNETLLGWIGRGPSTLKWPLRNPHLTSCDNSVWGLIKLTVRKSQRITVEEL